MSSAENEGNLTLDKSNAGENNPNEELNDEKGESEQPSQNDGNNNNANDESKNNSSKTGDNDKNKKRKSFIPSIDLLALKELEGTTTSSFTDLAQAVILIDGVPYDKDILPMSKARKIDFERLIAHHAQLEIYGSRKYHIKSVFNRVQKNIDNDIELKIAKKQSYTKTKPLTEAQRKAQQMLYEAKKEKQKRDKIEAENKVMAKVQKKISELESKTATTQDKT